MLRKIRQEPPGPRLRRSLDPRRRGRKLKRNAFTSAPFDPPALCPSGIVRGGLSPQASSGAPPAAPRFDSRKCDPRYSLGRKKDRFAHRPKVANRSIFVSETLSGGSGNAAQRRAAGGMIMPPKGSTQRGGPPLGDSLVTFSSGRKSPGARGWKPRHGEECRGRGASPSSQEG